ncbi:MAG: hypothetical protein U5J95_07160 [Balneolaceae bacterium]|nr:hypothetical protein [Balneolaceae bacterium]
MYLLIIVLGLFSLPEAAPDTSVAVQGEKQAQIYINNIESDRNTYSNLWALSVLSKSSTANGKYIAKYLANSRFNKQIYDHFRDTSLSHHQLLRRLTFDIGSPQLLIATLLSTDDREDKRKTVSQFENKFSLNSSQEINYREIVDAITSGDNINSSLVPVNQEPFIHFILFYEGAGYLKSEFISKFADFWNEVGFKSTSSNLTHSFLSAALVRANFILKLHEKNLQLYSQIMEDKLLPNSSYRLNLYRALDYSIYRLGYYDKSLNISRNFTVPLAAYLGREDIKLNALKNQAVSLYNIGKIEESRDINLRVLQEAEEKNIPINKSSLYNNLGIGYWMSGKFNKYLEWQFKSLEIAEEENNISHQLSILKNLYVYYVNIKENDAALRYLNRAKKISANMNNEEELAKVFISAGEFQRDVKNDFSLALENFEKADSLLGENANFTFQKSLLFQKAKLYRKHQNYDKALSFFKKIQELHQRTRKSIVAI